MIKLKYLNTFINKIKTPFKKSLNEHQTIYIDINKCINIYSFSFDPNNGWHFYVATLKQYISNPDISYDHTYITKYYRNFKPKNCYEALFDNSIIENRVYDELVHFRDPQNAPMPWTPYSRLPDNYKTNLHGYGPKAREYKEKHFQKLVNLYLSIKEYGFNQNEFASKNDFVRGIILKKQNDFKFLVLSGIHRTAVLSAIGYKEIPVNFYQGLPFIVDIKNVLNWPCVKLGIYSEETAKAVFNNYFYGDGLSKAKKWGIF